MIVVTSETIANKRIVRTLGLVRGNTVRSRHLGRDVGAFFKNLVGGEIGHLAVAGLCDQPGAVLLAGVQGGV